MEKCKVCKNSDCTGDSLDIIQNACTDSTQLGCPEFSFATICLSVLVFFVIHFGDLILSRTSSEKLSTFMSTPLSTSTVTNEYINSINSEFNYQLAEMTLFQFPNLVNWCRCQLVRVPLIWSWCNENHKERLNFWRAYMFFVYQP